ncbi:hypothetical protein L2E82_26970 [Cichorium intybus]|uniref:Uncharacterized protein n=1 Tax=Cichorium intybus TaxID=13427 RepID=A0ACB9CRN3_CICIN|nr:hypothetical protein L2E82_26970 [Cichorium intybus]
MFFPRPASLLREFISKQPPGKSIKPTPPTACHRPPPRPQLTVVTAISQPLTHVLHASIFIQTLLKYYSPENEACFQGNPVPSRNELSSNFNYESCYYSLNSN